MSGNRPTINEIARNTDSLFSSEKFGKRTVTDCFYDHLTSLLKYYLATICNDEDNRFEITGKTYLELEQFALENSGVVEGEEGGETDW